MPKRIRSKKLKTVRYFLKVYFLTVFSGVLILAGTKMVFQPQSNCANSRTCTSDLTEKIENGAVGIFEGRQVIPPKIDLTSEINHPTVLGTNASGVEKHIYVDLAKQTLYAYEGTTKVLETFTSTGRWNKTPTGNFHIWEKLRSTRMAGGEGADAYDLPNVPYVMYFYHDFGLHGAYWHDNFGHTMSHGCVNLRQIDAQALFDWTDGPSDGKLGTPVSICDSFTAPDTCLQPNPINSTL